MQALGTLDVKYSPATINNCLECGLKSIDL